jgi:hypothetical protein
VWLADRAAGVARKTPVRLGNARVGEHIQVLEGLQLGHLVIVDPPDSLQEGGRIRVMADTREEADHAAH